MKNLFFPAFIFISILISCSDNLNIPDQDVGQTENRSRIYQPNSITTPTEAHQAVAFALSKLMHEDPNFKTTIVNNMVRVPALHNNKSFTPGVNNNTNERLKDLLILNIISDPYIKLRLNNVLDTLQFFISIDDPIKFLLEIDPLISINIPMDIVDECKISEIQLTEPDIEFPCIVMDYANQTEIFFSNGEQDIEAKDNFITCGFHVNTAIYTIIVNPNTLDMCTGGSLSDRFSPQYMDCTNVNTLIRRKTPTTLFPNCVLVDVLDDIIYVYRNNCDLDAIELQNNPPPSPPSGPQGNPPSGPPCVRADLEILPIQYNQNYLGHLYNISWGVFFTFDNQPCKGPENEFMHILKKAFILNGQPRLNEHTEILTRHEQIFSGKGKPQYKRQFKWWCLCYKEWFEFPEINRETVEQPNLWIEQPYVKVINMGSKLFVREATLENNWEPNNQGSIMNIAWHEEDVIFCTNNTNTSTMNQIGGSLNLGTIDSLIPGGNATITWNNTTSTSTSYTTIAEKNVKLGDFEPTYCAELFFPSFNVNNLSQLYFWRHSSGSANNAPNLTIMQRNFY